MTIKSINQNPPSCQLLDHCIDDILHPFDSADIGYLTSHLSVSQLRVETHNADIQYSVSRALGESSNFPWGKWRDACWLALRFRLTQAPVPQGSGNRHSFDIQEVKRTTDVVDVISRYTTLRKTGTRYVGKCPLHDDNHPSLTVYPEQQTWHCFGCGKHGDVIDFMMLINNVDTREACKQLAGVSP